MSAKIMGEVFELDIPRDEKFILLAYVDHADSNGENIYPAIATVMKKTGYSERSVQTITRKLEKRGLLIPCGSGRNGTNKWKYPSGRGAEFAGVQKEERSGRKKQHKGVQPTAPKPSLTKKQEPSVKEGQKPRAPKANDFPSNVLYRQVTEKYPKKANWHDVLVFMDRVEQRLGRTPTKDDLFPYYSAWTANGWNEWSINWLEYAVKGEMPKYSEKNGNGHKPQIPQGVTAAQSWLQKRQAQNG